MQFSCYVMNTILHTAVLQWDCWDFTLHLATLSLSKLEEDMRIQEVHIFRGIVIIYLLAAAVRA